MTARTRRCGFEVQRSTFLAIAALLALVIGFGVEPLLSRQGARANSDDIDSIDLDDWTPRQVGVWLKRIGLGHAAPAFERAGVDGDRLFELGKNDYIELGLTEARERVIFASKASKLQDIMVNDENPTANGFWEYRAVNRQFVAVAIPAIVVSKLVPPPPAPQGGAALWARTLVRRPRAGGAQ